MRGRLFNRRALGRAFGLAFVAAAIAAVALHLGPSSPRGRSLPDSATPAGQLTDDLTRCQDLSIQAKDDTACEAAWAENRRRFFTYRPAPSAVPNSLKR
jgi:conjugative transfer region protein TrbK